MSYILILQYKDLQEAEISAVFSDCYDMEDDYYEDYEDSHYYFPRRRETFTDLTGILWDHNKATPTFHWKVPP